MNFLIVNNNEIYRIGIIAGLRKTNLKIKHFEEAKDFIEALKRCANNSFDFVILEHDLPSLNGIYTTNQIRKNYPKTKVFFVTRKPEEVDLIEALRAGASGYLPASTDFKTLEKAITSILRVGVFIHPSFAKMAFSNFRENPVFERKTLEELLSPREIQVLNFVCEGLTSKQIALKVGLSERTISVHRSKIKKKTNTNTTAELISFAFKYGYFRLPE